MKYPIPSCVGWSVVDGVVTRDVDGFQPKPRPSPDGYLRVDLHRRTYLLHRLLCEAWHGPSPEDKPFALHRDDCRTNNTVSNLRWGSHSENMADWRSNKGTRKRYGQHAQVKLTQEDAAYIRGQRGKKSQRELAREIGCSQSVVYKTQKGCIHREI